MIQLEQISKSFGHRTLFEGITWQLQPGQRVGLVGANGAGKTTLCRILVGESEADAGKIHMPSGCRIGYLPQEIDVTASTPLLEFIVQGADHLLAMSRQLEALEAQLATAPTSQASALALAYTQQQERFIQQGGYMLESQAKQIAHGIGFDKDQLTQPVVQLSGGWRMRALLSRLLLSAPDILLLDEPTNHLDIESIEWLEGFLHRYQGCVILISHDRYFLNRVVTHIARLTPHDGLRQLPGNYDDFLLWEAQEHDRLLAQKLQQDKEIARIEAFVDRFRYKASKAKQAQSRLKHLEKLERVEVKAATPGGSGHVQNFRFPQPQRLPKVIVQASALTKAYGDHVVYDGADFLVQRGDKIALVGPNGAGKSTLLKMLAGALAPDSGQIVLSDRVERAYFAQHTVDQLDLSLTVTQEAQGASTLLTSGRARDVLAAFGFSGDTVNKRVSVLSGGEKMRLALAKMLLAPAGLLLLDEPTNHLDIESREMLEVALIDFEGAFCVISHDRFFLNHVATSVVHIEDRQITRYDGDYDYYKWKHAQDHNAPPTESPSTTAPPPQDSGSPGLTRKQLRQELAGLRRQKADQTATLRARVQALETQIFELESELDDLRQTLADPQTYQDQQGEEIDALGRAFDANERELERVMEAWEAAQLALEAAEEVFLVKERALEDP